MRIVRVRYGKTSTPEADREYQIDGTGPVGTLAEYKAEFPGEEFEIEDINEEMKNEKIRELAQEHEGGVEE